MRGEYIEAIIYANKALQYEKISLYEEANSYNTLASAYQYFGNYTEALDYFFKGLKIHEENKFMRGIAVTYNNIAAIYNAQDENEKSLELYLKAKKIFIETNNTYLLPATINNIASVYLKNINTTLPNFTIKKHTSFKKKTIIL